MGLIVCLSTLAKKAGEDGEINNQRKAFLDMLAVEGTDNGTSENQKSWLWRHCRRRAIYWLLRSPSQTCHAKPKTQINKGAGRYQLFFLLVGCLPQAAWPERLLSESQDAVALQQIKERGALPMIDRGDIRQAIDRCSNIWGFTAGRWLWSCSSIRLTAWLQNSKKRVERSKRLMYEQSQRLSPLWLSASSSACRGLLIITVITPLPTKPSATKMPENWSWRTRYYFRHADASAWMLLRSMQIHEGVSWC